MPATFLAPGLTDSASAVPELAPVRPVVLTPGDSASGANRAAEIANVITSGTHDGVSTSYDANTRAVSITNTDKGSVAVATHEATPNVHQIADVAGLQLELDLAPFESTGAVSGLALSIHPSLTSVTIAPGVLIFTDFTDPAAPLQSKVSYPGGTVAITNIGSQLVTYLAINSSGSVVQQGTPFTPLQRRSLVPVGIAIHSNLATINAINAVVPSLHATGNQLHDLLEALGGLNVSGNVIGPNGANLQLNRTAGSIFKFGANPDYEDPHNLGLPSATGFTFRYRLSNGTEGADRTTVDPNNYEVPPGTVAAVPAANRFTIQRFTLFQSGLIRAQYGQAWYSSMADAEAGLQAEAFTTENNIATNGLLRCYLIVQDGATDLSDPAQAKFLSVGKFGATSTGGTALTAANIIAALGYTPESNTALPAHVAAADPHTQYVLAAGDTMTGPLTLPSNGLAVGGTELVVSGGLVGVGTSSPTARLDVGGGLRVRASASLYDLTSDRLVLEPQAAGSGALVLAVNNANSAYRPLICSGSEHHFLVNGTERMRIDASGNIGIGTSTPGARVDIRGNGAQVARVVSDNGVTASLSLVSAGVFGWELQGGSTFKLIQDATTRITVDAAGKVGIGVPSPEGMLHVGAVRSYNTSADSSIVVGGTDNGYVDTGAASHWRAYVAGDASGQALRFEGFLRGTGWVERARIDSAGNTRPQAKDAVPTLLTTGEFVFNRVSDTQIKLSMRGSDGVTRSVTLTLS